MFEGRACRKPPPTDATGFGAMEMLKQQIDLYEDSKGTQPGFSCASKNSHRAKKVPGLADSGCRPKLKDYVYSCGVDVASDEDQKNFQLL